MFEFRAPLPWRPSRRLSLLLAFVSFACLTPQAAPAADRYWVFGGSSFWELAGVWSATQGGAGGAGAPVNGDNAFIIMPSSITVTRDNITPSYTPPGPALVRLAGTGGAVVTLSQTANQMAASTMDIGYAGTAQYVQTAGSNVVSTMNVGAFGNGVGTYTLDGSGSLSVSSLFLGRNNNNLGTFNQNSGDVFVDTVTLGFSNAGAHGFYNLSNGFLLGQQLVVADVGTSVFSQTGGSGQFNNVFIGSAGAGSFNISGGSFTATAIGTTHVGNSTFGGAGSLNVSGTGNYNALGGITIESNGSVTVSGGTLAVSGSMNITGGRFNHNAGTFLPASGTTVNISAGIASFSSGYTLPPNTGFNVVVGVLQFGPGFTYIGKTGIGTLSASGGAAVVNTGTTLVGWDFGSNATVDFSDFATGLFSGLRLGDFGTATFNVSSGATVTTGEFQAASAGTAVINVSGVNSFLQTPGASPFTLGQNGGTGTLNLTANGFFSGQGGTHTVGRNGSIIINGGYYRNDGPLLLDGGTLSDLTGGFLGTPSLTVKNGGYISFSSFRSADPLTNVQSDGIYDMGSNLLQIFQGMVFNLSGGRLTAGSVQISGTGELNFTSGTLDIRGGDGMSIDAGGIIGNNVNLTSSKALLVADTTTLTTGSSLSLDGGLFATGALSGPGSFSLNMGTLRLTNSDMTVGGGSVFGNSLQLNTGARVEIMAAGKAIVQPGALLQLNGGSLSAGGGVTNSGEIQLLGGSASHIGGGSLLNNALLRGSGRIDSQLSNSLAGTVRAASNDSLLFTGFGNSNSGLVQLLGGVVEFQQGLTNTSTGRINGRGTLIATTGLTNDGSITFSGGPAEVMGALTNNNASKVLVTGGSTSTFYDAVTNNAGSQFTVSAASVATFLGPVTGLSAFSGSGMKIFEGPASIGALNTVFGDTVVDPGASVTAQFIRENMLDVEGLATVVPNGTSASTSRVNVLSIGGTTDNWTGTLDLSDNDLVVDYGGASPLAAIQNQIKSAYAGGAWNGNGISSSAAAASMSSTALGYAEASELGLTNFSGQSVDNSSVLIRYTYSGDANLDGAVDTVDFNLLAASFGSANALWSQGDFNYDGAADTIDFNLLASNFGSMLATEAFGALVPEPAAVGILPLALCWLWKRARSRPADIG